MRVSSPPKVAPEMVRGVMETPPNWLAASYIPAHKCGRCSLEVLAYAVTAALPACASSFLYRSLLSSLVGRFSAGFCAERSVSFCWSSNSKSCPSS